MLLDAADFQTGLEAYNRGDFATALAEWQPIAAQGDPNAQYNLGLLYARGQGVPQDYAKAAEWYRKAAEKGVAAAQYNLGVMYANGQGVARDNQEASRWFLQAAEKGVGDAASGLGRIYNEGEGAFRNPAEAEKWYRKAAEQGVGSAAFSLGVMYDLGQGVPRNYEEALQWYRKAADAGYASAYTNIGILYYNAQGVKRDLVEAYNWFGRAQKLGDPRAPQLVTTCAAKMKPGEIKKAQALLASWQPPKADATRVETAGLFAPRPAGAAAASANGADRAASGAALEASAKPPKPAATGAGTVQPVTAPPASSAPAVGTTAEASAKQPPAGEPTATPAETGQPSAPASAKQVVGAAPAIQDVWNGVERVVAVGDVHGDYEQFTGVLASAGLIDGNGDWVGGRTHLVQTGDIVDRGPDSKAVMDLLMKLEKQAAAAGGAVHCLIGNHEAMNVYGDLRYVSPGELAAFAPGMQASGQFSYQVYRAKLTTSAKPDPVRGAGLPEDTPGYAEHRAAFGPNGIYGKWIRSHNAAIKIDRTLFLHAGLGKKYADWTLDQINREAREELNDLTRLHGGIDTDEDGPLWNRALAEGDEAQLAPLVDRLLARFDVDRIVIGHTYAQAAITPRFGGKVVLVDIGLSRVYDNVGKMGCLVIENGYPYALHRGQKLELPPDENGPGMLRYLREAAVLDPQPSPLNARIAELQKRQ